MFKRNLPRAHSRRFLPQLEVLEDRLAPAALLSATTLVYHDTDGDLVTVKLSKPLLTAVDPNTVFQFTAGTGGVNGHTDINQQLQAIDLKPLTTNGLSLKVTAKQDPGGNGLANVPFIDATGFDVASVNIAGDLGYIRAGDPDISTPGLGTLRCQSMGVLGGVGLSWINGTLSKLQVTGTIQGAVIHVAGGAGGADGDIGSVIVGDSLTRGAITADGRIARVKIGGSITGGSDNYSGSIVSQAGLGPVTIGGSLTGGSGQSSGSVTTTLGNLTRIKVAGFVVGGAGLLSGAINAYGNIGPIYVAGGLQGGVGDASGGIYATTGNIGPIYVHESILGGGGWSSGSVVANGQIASLRVGRAIQSGAGSLSGSIRAGDTLGPITVVHILGSSAATPVIISARGLTKDLAIAKLTVAGDVAYTSILAGYDVFRTPVNGDAQIGPIVVGGNWMGSNVAAGAKPGSGGFGSWDDAAIGGGASAVVSKIVSVTIKGNIVNTPAVDQFGLVAEWVGSVHVGSLSMKLTSGAHNDNIIPIGPSDLFVHEVVPK